ncbi:MAG: 16S rRNA (uracil(1498)-N(3))-methyltransferase [Clostridia bacterium]|nr:16S rRNA (uracil(1498)-N(3))-methyltransferase [Clostridia bacterium]
MPRFFVEPDCISETSVHITGEDARHIARSLRMAVGDELTVSDAMGREYLCRLTRIRDEECELEILSMRHSLAESPVDITVFMAYPKSDKLELVIQKAAELGAMRVIPFESSRCIKRPKEDKANAKRERLNRIAREACGQCGRASLLKVEDPIGFEDMLTLARDFELSLFCYEGEGTVSLREVLEANRGVRRLCVIVGSEGGFSESEAAYAARAGLVMTGLGRRILRCETAPLYALSAISYALEL